jgi:hypothetical protein
MLLQLRTCRGEHGKWDKMRLLLVVAAWLTLGRVPFKSMLPSDTYNSCLIIWVACGLVILGFSLRKMITGK